MDYAVPVDLGVIIKNNEKRDKNLDLAIDKKKLWYMMVIGISILIGTLVMTPPKHRKELEGIEIRGLNETIQMTFLR